eukprot:958543-Pleurochrysis_carterae.AAC.1
MTRRHSAWYAARVALRTAECISACALVSASCVRASCVSKPRSALHSTTHVSLIVRAAAENWASHSLAT